MWVVQAYVLEILWIICQMNININFMQTNIQYKKVKK